jgi:hypothetical protein
MPLRCCGAAARDARPGARYTLAWGARCARAGLTPLNSAMERKSSADSPPRTPLRSARCGAAAPAAPRTWGFRASRATLARSLYPWHTELQVARRYKRDMIDNYTKAMKLVEKMKAHLPIPARPEKAFIRTMRENRTKVTPGQELQIESVLYLGDEGGIACAVEWPGQEMAVIVSLTHIHVEESHPLAKDIQAYQIERSQRLRQAGRRRGAITLKPEPRQKRKRRRKR